MVSGVTGDIKNYYSSNEEITTVKVTKINSKLVEKYYGKDVANDFTAKVQLPISALNRLVLRNKLYKIKNCDEN